MTGLKCGHRGGLWSILVVPHIFAGRPHIPRSPRRAFGGSTRIPKLGSEVPMIATWRKHAACRGIDPDVFYPASDEEAGAAKAVCDQCVVREACLEHALANREREGVWGGATERERRRIHRQRRKSA